MPDVYSGIARRVGRDAYVGMSKHGKGRVVSCVHIYIVCLWENTVHACVIYSEVGTHVPSHTVSITLQHYPPFVVYTSVN